ncbi:MAG: hypothetical protein KH386_07310, partial [Bacteroides sp.]|nr:hypothetical protein [Bacteroides sp.]
VPVSPRENGMYHSLQRGTDEGRSLNKNGKETNKHPAHKACSAVSAVQHFRGGNDGFYRKLLSMNT